MPPRKKENKPNAVLVHRITQEGQTWEQYVEEQAQKDAEYLRIQNEALTPAAAMDILEKGLGVLTGIQTKDPPLLQAARKLVRGNLTINEHRLTVEEAAVFEQNHRKWKACKLHQWEKAKLALRAMVNNTDR